MTGPLNTEDRTTLLRVARQAIAARIQGTHTPVVEPSGPIGRRAGAFVTIHHHGELRGCIGHIEADRPLVQTIVDCAVAASSTDPRFPPVTASELEAAHLEISILGPLEQIATADEIEIGRHGLLVERGWNRGLLLPQVAIEHGWDRPTFIRQTCRKAGLPADAWQSGATVWRFEAEVFEEERRREGDAR